MATTSQVPDSRKPATADAKTEWRERFAVRVLQGLDIKPTLSNIRQLVGWMTLEGGHYNGASNNPLNTTKVPSSGSYGNTGSQGNIKVYSSFEQGVKATVDTLKLDSYGGIRGSLLFGNDEEFARAVDASPWNPEAVEASLLNVIRNVDLTGNLGKLDDAGKNATGVVSDVAGAITAVPDLIKKLFQPSFWLSVGKILMGIIALILGIRYIGKNF